MAHSALANLLFNIIIPVVIMTRFTDELGALNALLIALAFPVVYGLWDWYKLKELNMYSALGLVSVLLTGVIGALSLPAKYLAYKEAAIPLIIALVFLFSSFTKWDLTTKFLGTILKLDTLHAAYKKKFANGFEGQIAKLRWAFIGSFIFSSIANYALTIVVVTAEPATVEFTEQIGRMTALSFPVIALPVLIVLCIAFFALFRDIQKVTKKPYESFVVQPKK